MGRNPDELIDSLVEDLHPAKPMRFSRGIGMAAIGLAVAILLAALSFGFRPDLVAGRPNGMIILGGGLFFLLGISSTAAVLAMSSPRVGVGRNGWGWAAAMASLLPLTALIVAILEGSSAWTASEPNHGIVCFTYSLGLGLIIGGTLVAWLRRGAPTSLERAGLLTGIAAGSGGVVAFSLVCPINSIMHIGLWHGLAVTVSALAGRLIVPRLIRW